MKTKLFLILAILLSITVRSQVQTITLDGSKSKDADGSIQKYQWVQVGSTPSVCTITNSDKAQASVVPAGGAQWQPGQYTFQLTVTDNQNGTAVATTHVNVTSQAPTVDAGPSQSVQAPSTVTLHSSGVVSLGKVKSWAWTEVSGPNTATFNRTDTSVAVVSNLIAGSYILKATVTDIFGGVASDTLTITVRSANQVPAANAGGDQTISLPTNSVTIGGFDFPADATVAWKKLSGPNSGVIGSPATSFTQVSQLTEGKFVFQKTVRNASGVIATDNVTVIVKKKCNIIFRIFGLC